MKPELLVDGLGYPEAPRWHDGMLWFSDMQEGHVGTVAVDGALVTRVAVPGKPGGIGFDKRGALVASLDGLCVYRLVGQTLHRHADLGELASVRLNDMVVSESGSAYVGCFGYDLAKRERPQPAPLLAVSPAGDATVAAEDLMFANGMAFLDGGRTLMVAETAANRLTTFRVADDGALADRQIFAEFDQQSPDGICVDAEGGIWFGSPFTREFVRTERKGSITHRIPTPGRWAIACALGGPVGQTLFLLTAETDIRRYVAGTSVGRIEVCVAPVPALAQVP